MWVCVCVCVCLRISTLKEKRLELLLPDLVHLYSMTVARRSKGQRSRSHGYLNRCTVTNGLWALHALLRPCATAAGVGLHVVWLLRFLVCRAAECWTRCVHVVVHSRISDWCGSWRATRRLRACWSDTSTSWTSWSWPTSGSGRRQWWTDWRRWRWRRASCWWRSRRRKCRRSSTCPISVERSRRCSTTACVPPSRKRCHSYTLYKNEPRWTSLSSPDVKFLRDSAYQKLWRSANFWLSYLKRA